MYFFYRDLKEYRASILSRVQEPSALEIAAEQMRLSISMDQAKLNEFINSEESTLYSQAIHYANRMVALLIPTDVSVGVRVQRIDHLEDDTSVSNSVIESRSARSDHSDDEFFENDPSETGSIVIKMVSRFIDRVCTEGSVTSEHVRNLHSMVPGVVRKLNMMKIHLNSHLNKKILIFRHAHRNNGHNSPRIETNTAGTKTKNSSAKFVAWRGNFGRTDACVFVA